MLHCLLFFHFKQCIMYTRNFVSFCQLIILAVKGVFISWVLFWNVRWTMLLSQKLYTHAHISFMRCSWIFPGMYLYVHATSFLVQVWIGLQCGLFLGFLSFFRTPRVLLCNKPIGTCLPVMHTSPFCLIHFYVFHILMSFIACKKFQPYDFRYSFFSGS